MGSRRNATVMLVLATAALAGCSTDSTTQTTSSQVIHRSTSGAGAGASTGKGSSGSATGSGTSGVGSAAGGTTGSTTSSTTGPSCAAGQALLTSETVDLCAAAVTQNATAPQAGVAVTTLPSFGTQALSDQNGIFNLCVPEGQEFVTVFQYAGDQTVELAAQKLSKDQYFLSAHGGVTMGCHQLWTDIKSKLPADFDPSKALALVALTSLSDGQTCSRSGWQFSGQAVDGGPPAVPWPEVFLDYQGDVYVSGATTQTGAAVVYNIDVDAQDVFFTAINVSATPGCVPLTGTGFVGTVPVSTQFIGLDPVFLQ